MKSKISIDLDYKNNPIIKIEYIESADVRDKMVKRFLEQFGYESCWAYFRFDSANEITSRNVEGSKMAVISPISELLLAYHVPEIQKAVDSIKLNASLLEREERKNG